MEEQLAGQMSIFDCFGTPYVIDKPIRLIELFAGVGSQAMALRDIGAAFEHWKAIEIDKYAIESYNAIHNTNFMPSDITELRGADLQIVDKLNYTYLLTYSFPCTDLSVAGQMLGMAEGSGTRSALLWEVKRLLDECGENLPQVLVMENVTQVHSKTNGNMEHFQKWIDYLTSKGYSSYWKDMNAKDYGVAQSRSRCFMVSILGDYTYKFPEKRPLDKCMKDYLEDSVDENWYITNQSAWKLIDELVKQKKIKPDQEKYGTSHYPHGWLDADCSFTGISPTLDAGLWKHHTFLIEKKQIEFLGNVGEERTQGRKVFDSNGVCPTLLSGMTHGNTIPYITEVQKLGHLDENSNQRYVVYDSGAVSPTLQAVMGTGGGQTPYVVETKQQKIHTDWVWNIDGIDFEIRIRKITPREAWRLMNFTDTDFEAAQSINSNTQLYKQAGNSICKNCLCLIFKNLLGEKDG